MFKLLYNLNSTKVAASQLRSIATEAPSNPQPWRPIKRVSRPTMSKIRLLAATQPDVYNVVQLSKEFKISVEAVRRILKSKYTPNDKDAERQERNRYKAMGERKLSFKSNNQHSDKK